MFTNNRIRTALLSIATALAVHAAPALALQPTAQPMPTPPASGAPTLIFQTNFEGQASVVASRGTDDKLVGRDNTLPTHSDPDAELKKQFGVSEFSLQYTGGDASLRTARIAADPTTPANKVLHFHIKEGWPASENEVKARVQANLYDFKPRLPDFYQSVRVYIPEHMNLLRKFPKPIYWLTISEFWNNHWWSNNPNGFRITLGMVKPAGENDLTFVLEAEDAPRRIVWKEKTEVKVPIGKWFTMDYYLKDGNASTGRFYLAITPDGGDRQVVYDVHNFTHNTTKPVSDGISHWNPLKLYTSAELAAFMKQQGSSLDIYWDDLRVWTNKHP